MSGVEHAAEGALHGYAGIGGEVVSGIANFDAGVVRAFGGDETADKMDASAKEWADDAHQLFNEAGQDFSKAGDDFTGS